MQIFVASLTHIVFDEQNYLLWGYIIKQLYISYQLVYDSISRYNCQKNDISITYDIRSYQILNSLD